MNIEKNKSEDDYIIKISEDLLVEVVKNITSCDYLKMLVLSKEFYRRLCQNKFWIIFLLSRHHSATSRHFYELKSVNGNLRQEIIICRVNEGIKVIEAKKQKLELERLGLIKSRDAKNDSTFLSLFGFFCTPTTIENVLKSRQDHQRIGVIHKEIAICDEKVGELNKIKTRVSNKF